MRYLSVISCIGYGAGNGGASNGQGAKPNGKSIEHFHVVTIYKFVTQYILQNYCQPHLLLRT